VLVNACSPGFIRTDMTADYADAGPITPKPNRISDDVTILVFPASDFYLFSNVFELIR